LPDRWDIYQVDFGQPMGHEPASARPGVIVSYDELNHTTPYVTVCPLTGTRRRLYGCEVRLPASDIHSEDSIIQVQLVRTLDARRLRHHLGHLHDPEVRRRIEQSLLTLLGLGTSG
jgi:mRNA interferase MazF